MYEAWGKNDDPTYRHVQHLFEAPEGPVSGGEAERLDIDGSPAAVIPPPTPIDEPDDAEQHDSAGGTGRQRRPPVTLAWDKDGEHGEYRDLRDWQRPKEPAAGSGENRSEIKFQCDA